ncbi:hypothetical protein PQ465_08630 [Sphingobacterium oryzagri]|uniref:DoxX family protein n=1 Tax=Sphingobacterium oryzagri TaxID=3025669 RepID=A0ABY7WLF6_9SPHI|nr:hypothetical protein [Sphingobacterium sp. KACC 22765]WDF70427.1 hypothetical protein PQ465_08630 [Sphingobacterium sp. KACC 22765]
MSNQTAFAPVYAPWQRYLIRVGVLFIILLSLPLQADFYRTLFGLRWSYLVTDLFNLLVYLPHFFGEISQIYDWLVALFLALIGAGIWFKIERKAPARDALYFYLLRIFVRFRLAAMLFVAGFTKLFAIFAPELSLSHLNTGYGYFEDLKHLYLSLSAAPAYLVFLGVVELLAAVLLLFRRTSFLAVIIIIPFYGNVFLADLAYAGDYYLASAYIVLLTLPVFLYDVERLSKLIVDLQLTLPERWKFDWKLTAWGRWKWALKFLFFISFGLLVGFRTLDISRSSSLYYPEQKGLEGIAGKYAVDNFIWNGDTLAFSPTDSLRWKDVVFEEWNTLSVRVNHAVKTTSSPGFLKRQDTERDYEYAHVGDRLYYRYTTTGDEKQISLQNPNPNYVNDRYSFAVERPDSLHVRLIGSNLQGDSLIVSLSKLDKKYLLHEVKKEGRRKLGFKL